MINVAALKTLNGYLAKRYFWNFLFLLFALLMIVYLFDMVELIRRASKRDDIGFSIIIQMGFLKLPEVGQVLLPFAILFSAMFTFWQMTQKLELIVMRAAGFSVWQFLVPILMVAFFIGLFQITIINPLGALFLSKFEDLEYKYLSRNKSQIALFEEGLWLRQDVRGTDGYAIFHAERINQPEWRLDNITILQFSDNDEFISRLDAGTATLTPGYWLLQDVYKKGVNDPQAIRQDTFEYPTSLTVQDIEESFSSPETMSFWRLPSYIHTLEATGFDASRLKVHYFHLWAQPFLFASLVLLAATVSMRPPRFHGATLLIAIGIFIGFIVFFMSNFLQALGSSNQIPVLLAAWAPAFICLLLGLSTLMAQEDG